MSATNQGNPQSRGLPKVRHNPMNNSEKQHLIDKIREAQGLTDKEKTDLINFLNESKTYGLVWENKKEDIEEKLREELPVLVERNDEKIKPIIFKDPNAPNHIIIEGDNLAALTDLSYTHAGKIDVIYIDPPYNTGNKDFIYNDDYVGKDDAFRHSQWLSFMSKRLKFVKNLLSEKGVIYISIGDDEDAQLKLLCNEIFGEQNKISDVIWQSRKSVSNDAMISLNHNYTLVYAKNIDNLSKLDFRLPETGEKFSNPDNDSRGLWIADPFDAPGIRPNLTYPIINPQTGQSFLPAKGRCWRTSEKEYYKFLNDNRIVFGKKGNSKPQLKRFLKDAEIIGKTTISIWNDIETTTNGTQLLDSILGERKFNNPKPIELIDRILKLSSKKNSIILDFFAGSGTTLHATMQLNKEDGGKRTCILCTNNENKICEDVTYERNKRVIEGYTKPNGEKIEGLKDNNLRYYKTEFVSRESTNRNRRELMYKSTTLLNIKEDLYTEIFKFGRIKLNPKGARYFKDDKKKMLVIYRPEFIPYFVEEIDKMEIENPIMIYVYSPGKYAFDDEFEIVAEKVQLCALPQAIIDAMSRVLPDKKDKEQIPETEIKITEGLEEIDLFANLKED